MGVKEYYDLQEDPAECRNRFADDPRARVLEERLKALLVEQGREDDFMRGGELDDATAQAHTREPPAYAR